MRAQCEDRREEKEPGDEARRVGADDVHGRLKLRIAGDRRQCS
jgi:hypothetical protein